ncbi:transposase [Allomeiothermus silvanus]|uniref:transposase n=1 Tax=Allomeiothermus silvanus TaxID=52022 RepID=UPI00019E830D|nr:transposase [Allomeiothermus silvanus]
MSLLSVKCKLIPNASTADKLSRTVDQFANACNYALRVARQENVWNKFALQKLVYRELRERFGLSANLAVRAIARVGKRKGHKAGGFKATSVDYDQRILSVNVKDEAVSLSTVDGRVRVPMRIAGYQRHLLRSAKSIQGGQLVS